MKSNPLGINNKILFLFLILIFFNLRIILATPDALHCIDYSANDATLSFSNNSSKQVEITIADSFRKNELLFKVAKCLEGDTLRFICKNTRINLELFYSYDSKNWCQIKNIKKVEGGMEFDFVSEKRKVFIALVADAKKISSFKRDMLQYSYEKLVNYIDSVCTLPNVVSEKIDTSVQGRDIYKFTITNNNISEINKKHVWLNFRVHGDEATQSYVLEGIIEYLLGGSSESIELLSRTVYHIVPLINPDGAFNDERENANGIDLNRNWNSPDTLFDEQPEIAAIHSEINKIISREGKKISHVVDFHGWHRAEDGGFRSHYNAGVCSVDKSYYYEQKSYVDLIKKNDSWQSYWEYSPGKITMSRIALYKEHGLSIITQEYPSTYRYDSTMVSSEQLRKQGIENLKSIDKYIFPISFIDKDENDVSGYYKNDSIKIKLVDYDAGIANKSKKNEYSITLITTSGDTENVVLTETEDTSGVFLLENGIAFEQASANSNDGVVQISTISEMCGVFYNDSDYTEGKSWDYVTLNTGETPIESIAKQKSLNLSVIAKSQGSSIVISLNVISLKKSMVISIYSTNGRMVKRFNSNDLINGTITLKKENGLASGLYFCSIVDVNINKQIPLLIK